MNFLTPLAFALAALLPVIVALYFLKLRREEQTVASVYLWRELVRDTAANAPWQRLRANWLLVLQLLFLIALIVALARPFIWTQAATGSHLILVVDTSASMAATDVAPDRLGSAVVQARRLAADLPADVPVTLIVAGSTTEVLLSGSTDRGTLERTLALLRPGPGGADLATALELAAAVAAGEPEAQIVVLSDGGARLPERLSAAAAVRYLPIGTSGENQALSAFSLDPAAAGQGLTAFVRVTQYGAADMQRRLLLYQPGGELLAVRDLTLPAGQSVGVTFPDLPPELAAVEARLEGTDALAADDRAWAVAPLIAGAQIQLVGPGNRFLETALALLPGVEVTTLTLEDYEKASQQINESTNQRAANWLTIFDTVLPSDGTYPPGALLFIGPLRSTEFFSVTGELTQPAPLPASATEPLLQYVDLRDVVIVRAAELPLPAWGRPVIVAEGGATTPLLIAGELAGRRLAVLAFDPRQSDLPLRVAFPLLLANLVDFLAPGATGALPETVTPGQPVSIPLPPQADAALITGPDGATARIAADRGAALFAGTATPGLYTVAWTEPDDVTLQPYGQFAVNAFSAQESEIAPRATLPIAGNAGTSVVAARPVRQEWWRPLAWAALILLLVEWLVQYRGTLAWLVGRVRGQTSNAPWG